MKKFDYIKWVTENKHGLLNEQRGGDEDLEKNKLRSTRDETPPPGTGQTQNAHTFLKIAGCDAEYIPCFDYPSAGFPLFAPDYGFQCNGQMCDQSDLQPGSNVFELQYNNVLVTYTLLNYNVFLLN